MQILVINCGSSSVKYQLVNPHSGLIRLQGKVDRVGEQLSYDEAVVAILAETAGEQIDAVGHRVVHGGESFTDACLIDDAVITRIEALIPLAPLHNPANLAGIHAARSALGHLPQVAVFDTSFHSTLPRRAKSYAVDPELAARLQIRRYGFHGPSHDFVTRTAAEYLKRPLNQLRFISCHLGNGASVAAVEFGSSIETSMGMTPLEGLVMGTRCGDIDPGVVLTLQRDGFSIDEVDELLNRQSGLLGLSGIGRDLRDIEAAAAQGNERARLAIAVFAHRVRKYIGAYAAVMGGVDAIIVTGGIGENSITMRRRILQRLEFLGIILDEDRNEDAKVAHNKPVVEITAAHARTKVLVAATNEELMIAQEAAEVVGGKTAVGDPGPIPIAVSARHIHLDQQTLEKLFGPDYQLTERKKISQPGQFAAEETLTLIGPRSQIEGVRVLGPLRRQTQVEISRTDEFKLGVDAPIRGSGQIAGSAPITLSGPFGSVHLSEGLICARRHIHMTPDDALQYGVEDGDVVEVAIMGGERDLVFGDVLIRVSPKYLLEMHIDTDEANAAELQAYSNGNLVYTDITKVQAGLRRRKPTPFGAPGQQG